MSWVREAYQMFVSIRICQLLGTASSKEKTPSRVLVFCENKCVFSMKIPLVQIYFINTQVSIYILSIYTSEVCRALLSIVLPAAVASDKSALNVWFQIQEDEQQVGLNKHLRDSGMAFTKSAPQSQSGPPYVREPPHKSEARFFWGRVASWGRGHWPQVGLLIC